MSTYSETPKRIFGLPLMTLVYVALIPFINWSFTWAPMTGFVDGAFRAYFPGDSIPDAAKWLFNPVTIVTGLVLVVRDFAQREIGHWVLVAMAVALVLTAFAAGPELALASGAAFAIAEMVDWALFTFTKYKLSTRVLLSSAIAAPLDTTIFLYGAEMIRDGMLTGPNITMSIIGKMVGAVVIWWIVRRKLELTKARENVS
ncbi:MAG: VUT family protein [Litorimonas sp.]